ncbi:DUF6636 domain-containing protein [Defluviimonas salinarum]|uniref:CVNH domain-containing protein n=1 Tax=Defluviimonas salinarum TaxID=2992147 RepID=A0ABT3J583_9RHOB|nr:DUF6636 domain-containing protein [Defluviimonas salinarum]MCW3782848.1 hypothetical protein [Defluviimonas salinarum]
MLRPAVLILLLGPLPAHADIWTFETPSENIQCTVGMEVGMSDIQCTIIERHGAPALPRPADCASDWGHSFLMLDRGPVQMLCEPLYRGRDGFHRADYGVTGTFGGFVCHSSQKGLECRNRDGHGFFLSRAVQTVF